MEVLLSVFVAKFVDPISFIIAGLCVLITRQKWIIFVAAGVAAIAVETVLTMTQLTRLWGQGLAVGYVASLAHAWIVHWLYWTMWRERKRDNPMADNRPEADRRPEDQTWLQHLVGGSVTSVIVRLLILSAVVGFVLVQLGLTPLEFYEKIANLLHMFARWLRSLGLDVLWPVLRWIGIGALVVVPIWLVARLVRYVRSR